MMYRFRNDAISIVNSLAPKYRTSLRIGSTSFRPSSVELRKQSIRANDRLLHIDAFPSRPNYGERILRVFANINHLGQPRVWRLGESFETVANRFLKNAKPYHLWQAKLLNRLKITKQLRSEYDHIMLQLHDLMKRSGKYQQLESHLEFPFAANSVWICFSDQASHAVKSGQFMMEQTFNIQVDAQYHPECSPLSILSRLKGKELI